MWCPSVSLSVWANAWLAGLAAPDDVLDALSAWAPVQSVAAYDSISIGETAMAFSGSGTGGAMSLLATLRSAAGPMYPVLPVAGDVRGLPVGTEFSREALNVGEAVILMQPGNGAAVGLVPEFIDGDEEPGTGREATLAWTAYALPDVPAVDQHDLGDAEYALRSAVRTAAEELMALGTQYTGSDDPRDLVEDLVTAGRHHRIPDHAPTRAVRVLENAALVDAIVTVGAGPVTAAAHSLSRAQQTNAALQPLSAVVRTARAAAVQAILHSARRN